MKDLYVIYERMHFYHWQDDEISSLIGRIEECDTLQEFEDNPNWASLGPFVTTLYLLVSSSFNSDKDDVIKFLEYLLIDEHIRRRGHDFES